MRILTKFCGDPSNRLLRCGDFSRWRPAPFWIFKILIFLTVERLRRVELRRRAKFRRSRSNCG